MFTKQLEQGVAEWRQQMITAGIKNLPAIDELEGHLREDIRALVSSGTPEDQALQLAIARLGDRESLGAEFKKLNSASSRIVTMSVWLWIGAVIVLAIVLLQSLFSGRISFLLFSHVFSVTAGYGTALLMGCIGVCWVFSQRARISSPGRQQGLDRAVRRFGHLAMGLAVMGFVLGGIWAAQHLNTSWPSQPRAIGGLCATLWLVALWLVQQFCRLSIRTIMLLCILGNVVISLAWFGPIYMAAITRCWPLYIFLGVHLLFLGMGLVLAAEKANA